MTRDFSNGVVALSLLAVLTVAGSSAPSALRLGDNGFRAFLPRFEAGLHRFVNGDPGPWNEHVSRSANGSILGGFGGYEVGAQVGARYTWAASQFQESGATVQVEYLSTVVDGDLAYTVSIERSQVRIRGKAAPVPMALRVTHVFRRESGDWKLLHRHADDNVTRAAP
jgi:hypothetical protein